MSEQQKKEIPEIFHILAVRAAAASERADGDYIGHDGLLYCGHCHTAKQCRPFREMPDCAVSCLCECEIKKDRANTNRKKAEENERFRKKCFSDSDGNPKKELYATFAADLFPESENSRISRNFAKQVCNSLSAEDQNRRNLLNDNASELTPRPEYDWLLFSGTRGNGKSYYAACICNAIIDSGHTAIFTSISEFERQIFGAQDKSAVLNAIARYDLIVIDDFGAERDTEYMDEIKYNVIQYLLGINKPCIITTNLTKRELTENNNANARIYSRILQKSIPIPFLGEDLRKKQHEQMAAAKRKALLQG